MQAALHPTPAVCGRPRGAALAALSAAEPFDRGFYSGPFGWISGAAAEFAVAIRSALLHAQDTDTSSSQQVPSSRQLEDAQRGEGDEYHQGTDDYELAERRRSSAQASSSAAGSNGHVYQSAEVAHSSVQYVQNGRFSRQSLSDNWETKQQASSNGNGSIARAQSDSSTADSDPLRTISLYAGVGLVCGSDVDREWQVLGRSHHINIPRALAKQMVTDF